MDELEKHMYFGATPVTLKKAKQLRGRMTQEEEKLWNRLKGKQIGGLRFRRQHPIETFIVDFYCHSAKLVIELDGTIHLQQRAEDEKRTEAIEKYNIQVIRFTNEDIIDDLNSVITVITNTVKSRTID